MSRALDLAERGWGRVQPNPLVGAVIVTADGTTVGEAFHAEYGQAHAEVHALSAAGEAARGATMYVTLEPCSHHGQTPPCTDAILQAGLARVVFGAADPNPKARGGAAVLRQAGVEVEGPVADDAVRKQNAIFFHAHEQQRTFVALKLATSLDGRIAAARGMRTQLTGEAAQQEVQRLRAGYDAIMIGSGTARADDPLLTVRGPLQPIRPPLRVVVDSHAALPVSSRLVQTADQAPVLVFCAENSDPGRRRVLERAGVQVGVIRHTRAGLDLDILLAELWKAGVRSVFCEGGARVAGALARAGRIDRFLLFVAPLLLGPDAVNAFDSLPAPDRLPLELDRVQRFGDDVLLTYQASRGGPYRTTNSVTLQGYVHRFG